MAYDMKHLFICLFAICISSLVRYQALCLFFDWVGFFFFLFAELSELFECFGQYSFIVENILSSLWLILSVLTLSFAKQKFLIQHNLAHQLFISCIMTLALYLKSHCPTQDQLGLPLFFQECYNSHFTVKSVIYFQVFFVKNISSVSRFIFLHVDVEPHYMKRLSLFHYVASFFPPSTS